MISIIVPVYNTECCLERCIESILGQTYRNIEIILIDDGSTDRSGKICDCYAEKYENIKVIHIKNSGVSHARNIGIEVASGEYIGFVDSDDYIEPDMYETLLLALEENEAGLASCEFVNEYDTGVTVPKLEGKTEVYTAEQDGVYKSVLYSKEIGGFLCNKLFTKELITKKLKEEYSQCEDMVFVLEYCAGIDKAVHVKSELYHYFQKNQKNDFGYSTRTLTLMPAYEEILQTCEENAPSCVSRARTNLLKIYLNFRARYKLTKDKSPELKNLINNGIKKYLKCVLKDTAVSLKTKINILATYIAPKFMLRSKKRVQYKLKKHGIWHS